jgi:hypothetical protein
MISQRYHLRQGCRHESTRIVMPERKSALLLRISQGLKDRLSALAKQEHRSVNQQIEFILEQFLRDGSRKGGAGRG